MAKQTKGWAVAIRGEIALKTVRVLRSEAIYSWTSSTNPKFWRAAYRYGARAVRVTITPEPTPKEAP